MTDMTGSDEAVAAPRTERDADAESLAERLFDSLVPALELLTVELGIRSGLYRALAEIGPATVAEIAAHSALTERYVREWLEQQSVAGIVEVDLVPGAEPRFWLRPGHQDVLLDPVSPVAMAGASAFIHGIALALDALLADLPRGSGVSYADFGRPVRSAISSLNRPGFVHSLGDWMAALPDIHERLLHGGVIVDAGCGTGWSSIALATLYPRATVIGLDLDVASLAEARAHAADAGVGARVEFECVDVGDRRAVREAVGARAQLVTIFEALHDMNGPVRALSTLGGLLDDGGAILVADEKVADDFAPRGDFLERLNYAFSILHCLPATIAEGGGEANGTVLRAGTVARWAEAAGMAAPEILEVDNPVWRFYRLGVA